MGWSISKEFAFSASHQLTGLPETHQCARLHGHNYILVVRLDGSTLQEPGFILDYGELSFFKELVDSLDHRHLNDMFDFNPTSENIVKHIHDQFREEVWKRTKGQNVSLTVGLSETPKTYAWYTGDGGGF